MAHSCIAPREILYEEALDERGVQLGSAGSVVIVFSGLLMMLALVIPHISERIICLEDALGCVSESLFGTECVTQ